MSNRTATKENYTYLSQKPGLQLIKAGSYEKKELNAILGIPEVRSQILDVPITANTRCSNIRIVFNANSYKRF